MCNFRDFWQELRGESLNSFKIEANMPQGVRSQKYDFAIPDMAYEGEAMKTFQRLDFTNNILFFLQFYPGYLFKSTRS